MRVWVGNELGVMGPAWWGRLIRERNRPGEDLKRAGSPQVKISEPVPEAVDSKVGFIWFLLVEKRFFFYLFQYIEHTGHRGQYVQ